MPLRYLMKFIKLFGFILSIININKIIIIFLVLTSSFRDSPSLLSGYQLPLHSNTQLLIHSHLLHVAGPLTAPQPPQNDSSCFTVQSNRAFSSPCLQNQLATSLWKPTRLFTCSSTQWDISPDSFYFFNRFSKQKEMVRNLFPHWYKSYYCVSETCVWLLIMKAQVRGLNLIKTLFFFYPT